MNSNNSYKKSILLAIPMMIQTGITNAVGLVDNVMVGSLGTESITAVSIVIQLFFVYNLAVFGAMSGPGIYCAQYFGNEDTEGVKSIFRLKWWICIFCIILGLATFLLFGDNLIMLYLRGESTSIDAIETFLEAKSYLKIMLIGIIPFSISQVYATHLRETDDSFKPMVAGVCSVITDVLFNYLLIFGKFGFPELGVSGAAIATSLSRFCEAFVIVFWAHKRKDIHTFLIGIYKTLLVPYETTVKVIKNGIPIFINEFVWSAGVAAVTQCYSIRGLNVVAGLNISNALCNLMNVSFISLGCAVGIVVGQMLGAGEFEEAKRDAIKLAWFTTAISLLLGLALIGISGVFPKIYNVTEDVRALSSAFIIITAIFFPVQGLLNSLYFTLRSGGKTFLTFLFDGMYSVVIIFPTAYVLCYFTDLKILTIYTIVMSADLIKTVIGYVLVKRGIWITNLVS